MNDSELDQVLNAAQTLIIHHSSLIIFPEPCRSSDNMATKTRRHEEIAAAGIDYCAATACCALTTTTVFAVAYASSCLRAFVANLSALTFIIHHSSLIIFPEP